VLLPDNQSLITADGEGILVTALKKAQDEKGVVLRALNLSETESGISVKTKGNIYRTSMSEEKETFLEEGALTERIGGKKINTYKIARR